MRARQRIRNRNETPNTNNPRTDKVVGPHPPVTRGLHQVASALKAAGHKVGRLIRRPTPSTPSHPPRHLRSQPGTPPPMSRPNKSTSPSSEPTAATISTATSTSRASPSSPTFEKAYNSGPPMVYSRSKMQPSRAWSTKQRTLITGTLPPMKTDRS